MDTTADPCVDFYQYSCGSWLTKNQVPSDQSSWGRFHELDERNKIILRDILEKAPSKPSGSAAQDKTRDYYASCMDEKGIEAKGLAPLKPEFDRIAALDSKDAVVNEVVHLQKIGVPSMFRFTSTQDYKNASEQIAEVDQGGIGLPDRDYYLKDDAKSVEQRKAYVAHIGKMFELAGDSPEKAAAEADSILKIETALATASLDRVSRRDPAKVYHRMPATELQDLAPSFPWTRYFNAMGAPASVTELNVAVPEFFKGLEKELTTVPVGDWKTYFRWHLLRASAPLLPAAFLNENFNFYGTTLTGAKELQPRWKRCVQYTDADLGEALGKQYVETTFGAEGKKRMMEMIAGLKKALAKDIRELPWMTEETKKQALIKLQGVSDKIGYPDKWRDYSKLQVVRGDALGNRQRGAGFEKQRQLAKIGKPVDKGEWGMTPPTVNAYYDAQMNNINFPAGVLQPPFYENEMDDAVNYGGIGAVIGHELTHGFDDQGRKFDASGNMRDWWTETDGKEFETRAQCVADEYSGFTAIEDVKLNGKLTLGENTADNGGLRIAYMALLDALARKGTPAPKIDGFTPEQRFFLGWGQVWCTNTRDEYARMLARLDPHSPGKYRVNGTVSNMPEFKKAWSCKAGQPMVRESACRVW